MVTDVLEPIPAVTERVAGYSLDRSPVLTQGYIKYLTDFYFPLHFVIWQMPASKATSKSDKRNVSVL